MASVTVQFLRLSNGKSVEVPRKATPGSAGFDIAAADEMTIAPGQVGAVPTGFAIAIPEGFEAQVRPRSGLALKHGVTVLNAPGTIDADYRGEVKVILINHGTLPFRIAVGDRIAQLVIAPVTDAGFELVQELDATSRGTGGFGSTGKETKVGG
jgi:dUTP pyrophosphatase